MRANNLAPLRPSVPTKSAQAVIVAAGRIFTTPFSMVMVWTWHLALGDFLDEAHKGTPQFGVFDLRERSDQFNPSEFARKSET